MCHIGHMLLFKHAVELYHNEECRLVVAVQDGDFILKYKPEAKMVYSTEERMFMVSAIRWVDEVVTYKDVDTDIQTIDFDIFAKGPDQQHAGFQRAVEWCKANGKEVVVIPRTDGISSTMLREYVDLNKTPMKDNRNEQLSKSIDCEREIDSKELKEIQMDILQVLDNYCCQNNIKYSIACGTMLGAIRHKGYIPWDDDIDIYMLRDDYEKLMQSFPKVYKGHYCISSLERDALWDRPYAKAYDNRTMFQERMYHNIEFGVNIDIFPVDEVPDDETQWISYDIERRKFYKKYNRLAVYAPFNYNLKGIVRWIYYILPKVLISRKKISEIRRKMAMQIDENCKRFRDQGNHRVFECCQGEFQKHPFKKTVFDGIKDYPFENRIFKGFENYDEYLSNGFGDYMQLPPEEKRVSHHNYKAFWKKSSEKGILNIDKAQMGGGKKLVTSPLLILSDTGRRYAYAA